MALKVNKTRNERNLVSVQIGTHIWDSNRFPPKKKNNNNNKKKKTKTNGVLNILFLFFWLFSQNPMKNGTSSTKVLTYIK